ncbi:hypothetical protein [Oceaniglobus roseus]|uniref:hypothetical protein n=1 Tax=Oceaniglobus roseus TaxID=1737570 RepID=UPI0012FFD6EC|nr:hypothetical protein [Kandeliimicrobium roseum]
MKAFLLGAGLSILLAAGTYVALDFGAVTTAARYSAPNVPESTYRHQEARAD